MLLTGLGERQLQMLAARGKVPGAAKLGGTWTFDKAVLRRWIRQEQERTCRNISPSVTGSGTPELSDAGTTYDEAYEQALR
jgi:hypothetical protein